MDANIKKKREKTGGRKKGTPNKTTEELRNLVVALTNSNFENVQKALEEVRKEDPAKYVALNTKFIELVLPKQQEIKAEVEQMPTMPYEELMKKLNAELSK